MIICLAKILISTVECNSLKEKRSIVNSIKERIKNKFNIRIAEVDYADDKKRSLLGMATVSNDDAVANSIINKSIDLIETSFPGRITDVKLEMDFK